MIGYYFIYFSNLMLYSFLMADLVNYVMLYFSFFLKINAQQEEGSNELFKKKSIIVLLGVLTIFVSIYHNPYHGNPIMNIGLMLVVGVLLVVRRFVKNLLSVEMGVSKDEVNQLGSLLAAVILII